MTGEPNTRAEMLRGFLAEQDEPCPAGGYNLRGLTGEACPECGVPLKLRIGTDEPNAGWFTAGCVCIGASLGVQGVALLLSMPSGDGTAVAVTGVATAVTLLALIAWIRGRRRLAQAGIIIRTWATGGAVTLPVILLVTEFVIIALTWKG